MATDGAHDAAGGMTYLDYQATTPLAPEALAAMLPWLETQHANPHSPHRAGRRAKAAVEVRSIVGAAVIPRLNAIALDRPKSGGSPRPLTPVSVRIAVAPATRIRTATVSSDSGRA